MLNPILPAVFTRLWVRPPNLPTPPHPLILTSFAHRQLQPGLSAGFRDIDILTVGVTATR